MDISAEATAGRQRVQQVLDDSAALSARLERGIRELETMRVRRPSDDEQIVPEVDGLGRLTGLWLADGLTTRMSAEALAEAITEAITASNSDAADQRESITSFIGGTDNTDGK